MKKIIQIILILISCGLPQTRRESFRFPDEIVRELTKKKIRRRRPERKRIERKKFIPLGRYRRTKPRDHRFSDQKKLRRMYRNV